MRLELQIKEMAVPPPEMSEFENPLDYQQRLNVWKALNHSMLQVTVIDMDKNEFLVMRSKHYHTRHGFPRLIAHKNLMSALADRLHARQFGPDSPDGSRTK